MVIFISIDSISNCAWYETKCIIVGFLTKTTYVAFVIFNISMFYIGRPKPKKGNPKVTNTSISRGFLVLHISPATSLGTPM